MNRNQIENGDTKTGEVCQVPSHKEALDIAEVHQELRRNEKIQFYNNFFLFSKKLLSYMGIK